MLVITRAEYLDILFDSSKHIVEKVENFTETNVTTLIVNRLERAMRIISSDGVVYFKLM